MAMWRLGSSSGVNIGRVMGLALLSCALAGFSARSLDSPILFPRGSPVPRGVQAFAWRVVEERCAYQAVERRQRAFWATAAQATALDGGLAYSLRILSDVPWKKTEPTAVIEMTIVDDGGLRLTALRSSFVTCAL
ncbi:MAG TPA: hypothetical protein VJU81_21615 [Methylomirabilota bacterium]|nr:hypothetical protein [Methylomirabilota bacterium]